jgi:hypothetical protein
MNKNTKIDFHPNSEKTREKNFKALLKYSKADLAVYLLQQEFIDFSLLDEIRKDWKEELRKARKR